MYKTLVENPTMAMLVHQDVKVATQQGYFGPRSTLWSVGGGLGCHKSCPRPPSTSARSDLINPVRTGWHDSPLANRFAVHADREPRHLRRVRRYRVAFGARYT